MAQSHDFACAQNPTAFYYIWINALKYILDNCSNKYIWPNVLFLKSRLGIEIRMILQYMNFCEVLLIIYFYFFFQSFYLASKNTLHAFVFWLSTVDFFVGSPFYTEGLGRYWKMKMEALLHFLFQNAFVMHRFFY